MTERPRLGGSVRTWSVYGVLTLVVFVAAGYLGFANLDYVALWHDEAPSVILGNTLLEQGKAYAWDGRNLVSGGNGHVLNDDLVDTLPPLTYVLNAIGIALFGYNEVGARVTHVFVGMLSLVFLYLLLREHLPKHPRLVFFIFLFAAWSAQLLLFFRQSRYYAFMVFGAVAAFYLYERYWRTGSVVYLALLTLVAILSFFNHYIAGAATVMTIATWHLLFRARETTGRDYLRFGLASAIVVMSGSGYLLWLGVLDGGRDSLVDYMGLPVPPYAGDVPLPLLKVQIYMRDLFTADWISWPVFLWFIGMLIVAWIKHRLPPSSTRAAGLDDPPVAETARVVLMGALFVLFSALMSVQPVWTNHTTDLRYCVAALPFLLAMKGLFVEWTWGKSSIAGIAITVAMVATSIGAAPFNMEMVDTGRRTLGAHLFQFVREIHRPYPDAVTAVSRYLLQEAERDDLVYVPRFAYREPLIFYAGHHVRFCCMLDRNSPLPRHKIERLEAPLYLHEQDPDWIVLFGHNEQESWKEIGESYEVVERPAVYHRLTQRPALNYHSFIPIPPPVPVVYILRSKENNER